MLAFFKEGIWPTTNIPAVIMGFFFSWQVIDKNEPFTLVDCIFFFLKYYLYKSPAISLRSLFVRPLFCRCKLVIVFTIIQCQRIGDSLFSWISLPPTLSDYSKPLNDRNRSSLSGVPKYAEPSTEYYIRLPCASARVPSGEEQNQAGQRIPKWY